MRILRYCVRTVGVLLLVALALPFVWKAVTGDFYMNVTGISMRPTYEIGDVLVVQRPAGDELKHVGRIVVVQFGAGSSALQYVHRVHTLTKTGAWLQGDNNAERDAAPVTQSQVIGTPRFVLHGTAGLLFQASQQLMSRCFIAVLGMLALFSPIGNRKRRDDAGESELSPAPDSPERSDVPGSDGVPTVGSTSGAPEISSADTTEI